MSPCKRQGKRVLLTFLLLLPAAALAAPAEVLGLHFAPAGDHASLVFDLSAPTEYRIFTLGHPDRIVIDMDNTALQTGLPAGQGVIKDLRSGIRNQSGLRVVLDTTVQTTPRSLLRNTSAGTQLVVDLYPHTPATARVPVLTARKAVPQTGRDIVVAIDAGHGGIDSGARGPHGIMEKTITLQIARRLAAQVAKLPGFKPFLTRDGDYYLTLRQRIERARAAHADIFVSIHCDAAHDHYADGATVYALSLHGATSEHARLLAQRENDSDLLGGVDLSDKSPMLASVLLDLSQTATIKASLEVGGRVAQQLARMGSMHRYQVQQAAFVVLKSPDIPSILVETDYISNPREARQLQNPAYQQKVASAILTGVHNYFDQYPPPGTELAMEKVQHQQHNAPAIADDSYEIASGNGSF
ncbi:MAG TPA: N-acetylmuramoyl-L-alanine amidase [Gammaproteobacteria bacterium]|nr:N-acetylmuramoyl-L-alanine amidase [Gammaproteobacteria bacterium]